MYDPKVHAGAAALLLRSTDGVQEVLLMQRGPDATHGANTWALPGGWIDWGQTPAEAAARELAEEVGVQARAEDGVLVGVVVNTYDAHDMHVVCVAVRFDTYDDSGLENLEPEKCSVLTWTPVSAVGTLALFPPLEKLAAEWGWL